MFERFTERARQVVTAAQQEARELKHDHVGTEHLLLGLLGEHDGIGARVLESFHITLERVRGEVVRTVGVGEQASSGQMPFTSGASKVLELALREALSFGQNYVSPEHILLALVAVDDDPTARIFHHCGVAPDDIRAATIRQIAPTAPPAAHSAGRPAANASAVEDWFHVGPDASARRLLMLAAARALDDGRSEIEPHDILLALARDERTGPVLADLGVDEAAVVRAIERRRQAPPPPRASAEG